MTKLFLLLSVFCALALPAQDKSTFKDDTVAYLKLTGVVNAFENAIVQFGATVPEKNKALYTKQAQATLSSLYSDLAKVYMQEFTPLDIKALTRFYKTNVGKKLSDKQLLITQKSMFLGQSWAKGIQDIASKHQ